ERRSINIENLPSVRGVHRAWGDGIIRARIHVVPPEQLRAGELRVHLPKLVPEFSTAHQVIRLLPELDLSQFAVVPPVAYNAVLRRWIAGQVRRLCRASDRRKRGHDGLRPSFLAKPRNAWRVLSDQRLGEADDVDDGGPLHVR